MAVVVAKLNFNSDIIEGWVMLAAALVVSMIQFMHKAARSMKGVYRVHVGAVMAGQTGSRR